MAEVENKAERILLMAYVMTGSVGISWEFLSDEAKNAWLDHADIAYRLAHGTTREEAVQIILEREIRKTHAR